MTHAYVLIQVLPGTVTYVKPRVASMPEFDDPEAIGGPYDLITRALLPDEPGVHDHVLARLKRIDGVVRAHLCVAPTT